MHLRSFRIAEATSWRILTTFDKGVNLNTEVALQIMIALMDWVVNFHHALFVSVNIVMLGVFNVTLISQELLLSDQSSFSHVKSCTVADSFLLILFSQCEIQQIL